MTGTFIVAMVLGYMAKRRGLLEARWARPIMVFAQKNLVPWVLLVSFWGLELSFREIAWIPLLGLFVISFQLWIAFLVMRAFSFTEGQKGAFLVGAIMSNVGFLGWSVNLSLFGQKGFDIAFAYSFYFVFSHYFIAYPVAAAFSSNEEVKRMGFIKRITIEGIFLRAVTGIVTGVALNLSPWAIPVPLSALNRYLVVLLTTVMMFAAGLTVNLRGYRRLVPPTLTISFIKLVLSPLLVCAFLSLSAAPAFQDPLVAQVVMIQAMMPMAFASMAISTLFYLDQDFVNIMWFATTLLFFPALQGFLFLARYLL